MCGEAAFNIAAIDTRHLYWQVDKKALLIFSFAIPTMAETLVLLTGATGYV